MRAAAVAVVLWLACCGSALASPSPRVAYLRGSDLVVADPVGLQATVEAHHVSGQVAWSGDGSRVSVGRRVIGGPTLPAPPVWAPVGHTAAYATANGAVHLWTPGRPPRTVVPPGWGATSMAWSTYGVLALGRSICHAPCGVPAHQEVWTWRRGRLARVAGPLPGVQMPRIAAVTAAGTPLWWSDQQDSASIAADGLPLYAGNRVLAPRVLVFADYVTVCGSHVAVAAGRDRYATHGKRILLDGRDVSRDPARSWVSPTCSTDGRTLVAAAGPSTFPDRIGDEHRSLWQLLPVRRRLTSPPAGRSDEDPHLLRDGSVLFVRTRSISTPRDLYGAGTVELLHHGHLTSLGSIGRSENYYGHYTWPQSLAVLP